MRTTAALLLLIINRSPDGKYLSELPWGSYVAVKDQACWFGANTNKLKMVFCITDRFY